MTNDSPQYLEGLRAAMGDGRNDTNAPASTLDGTMRGQTPVPSVPPVPVALLSTEERIKRELHPLDAFSRLSDCAKNDRPPREDDQFRFRWFGLIYQGPRQDGFTLRLRLPGGRLQADQLTGLAALTQALAGGCVVCNAQGGLDIPGVPVRAAAEALRWVEEIGLRALMSAGDCVQAVRGGEYEELTDRSRKPMIYPLVRELELALAMSRPLSDLPMGCEVGLRGRGEAPSASGANGGRVIFQAVSGPSVDSATQDGDNLAFLLSVPGFGALDLTLRAAQVVPVCMELLGFWAEQGNRADRQPAGLAAFCANVGVSRLRERLTKCLGPLPLPAPAAQAVPAAACPPPVGLPVPAECLLSGMLERLAEVARCHGPNEVLLAGGQLFVPLASDPRAAEKALRRALTRR